MILKHTYIHTYIHIYIYIYIYINGKTLNYLQQIKGSIVFFPLLPLLVSSYLGFISWFLYIYTYIWYGETLDYLQQIKGSIVSFRLLPLLFSSYLGFISWFLSFQFQAKIQLSFYRNCFWLESQILGWISIHNFYPLSPIWPSELVVKFCIPCWVWSNG